MGNFTIGYFSHLNSELIQKLWQSIDAVLMAQETAEIIKREVERAKEKVVSIIHEPVWKQACAFQATYESYMIQSASIHKIPFELLSAIVFTEMTYDFTSLEFDDWASMQKLRIFETTSIGPGQMSIKNLRGWGYDEPKFELSQRLHTDMHFAIDASARLLNELVTTYQIRKVRKSAKNLELEKMRTFVGKSYYPAEWNTYNSSYKPSIAELDTENLEREAWPTIAEWYNAGIDGISLGYRDKFVNSLRTLSY